MTNGNVDDIEVQMGKQPKHLRVTRAKKSGRGITAKRGRT